MFENPRRGIQARNFTTNVPKILDLKSFSEQIFSRKLSLGARAAMQGAKNIERMKWRQIERWTNNKTETLAVSVRFLPVEQ